MTPQALLIESITGLYELDGCAGGGPLHIVVEDYNTEDDHINWCIDTLHEWLSEGGNTNQPCAVAAITRRIADQLLAIPSDQREALLKQVPYV